MTFLSCVARFEELCVNAAQHQARGIMLIGHFYVAGLQARGLLAGNDDLPHGSALMRIVRTVRHMRSGWR